MSEFIYAFIYLLLEFFAPTLADGLSQEFEWQLVSSCLQDSSQYSGRSQQCSSLDWLLSSSYFQVLQFLYQSFSDCANSNNYNWYHRQFHVPQFFFFNSLARSGYSSFFSFSFNFTVISRDRKVYKLFFLLLLLGLVVWLKLSNLFVSQNPRELCASHSPG